MPTYTIEYHRVWVKEVEAANREEARQVVENEMSEECDAENYKAEPTMTPETEKWLQEVRTRLEKADQVVSDLNHCKRQWVMSIPAQPEHDPDLVISASLADNERLAALLKAAYR